MKKSRLVIILVAVAVLTALFVWQGGNASEESTPPAPPSVSSTPAQQQESDILDLSAPPSVSTLTKPISFLEVQRALGPWVPVDPLRPTGQKVVLSRANGTLEEGSRVIVRDETWYDTKVPVTFTYDKRDSYVRLAVNNWFAQEVNYEQAFIFEIEPSAVYIIAADGTLYHRETSAILSP